MPKQVTQRMKLARPYAAPLPGSTELRPLSTLYVWVRGLRHPKPVQHTVVIGGRPDATGCGKDPREDAGWDLALPQNLSANVKRCAVCFGDEEVQL